MYNFFKLQKEVAYNCDIPHCSCLCEVCDNASLSAKGINSILKSSDIFYPLLTIWLKDTHAIRVQRITYVEIVGNVSS